MVVIARNFPADSLALVWGCFLSLSEEREVEGDRDDWREGHGGRGKENIINIAREFF